MKKKGFPLLVVAGAVGFLLGFGYAWAIGHVVPGQAPECDSIESGVVVEMFSPSQADQAEIWRDSFEGQGWAVEFEPLDFGWRATARCGSP